MATAKSKSIKSKLKCKLTTAPATRRLKKAAATSGTGTSKGRARKSKIRKATISGVATAGARKSTKKVGAVAAVTGARVAEAVTKRKPKRKGKRPGSPLAGTTGPSRPRTHRSATGRRLGPGGISGGV